MLSIGTFLGWSSPSLPKFMEGDNENGLRLNSEEASWVVSLLTLGAAVGSIFPVLIVNVIGRKKVMLLNAVPVIISWVIIAYATTSWVINS